MLCYNQDFKTWEGGKNASPVSTIYYRYSTDLKLGGIKEWHQIFYKKIYMTSWVMWCLLTQLVLMKKKSFHSMNFRNSKLKIPWCSFWKLHDETIMHLFYDCVIVKELWNQLKSVFSNVAFPICTLQSAIFEFGDLDTNEHLILNHLILNFKMYIYNARTTGSLSISHLMIHIKGIKDTEEKLFENNAKKRKKFNKWKNVLTN